MGVMCVGVGMEESNVPTPVTVVDHKTLVRDAKGSVQDPYVAQMVATISQSVLQSTVLGFHLWTWRGVLARAR